MTNAITNSKRKVYSMAAHGSALFSWSLIWIGVPLALICLVDDEIVKGNACEALNYGIVGFVVGVAIVVGIFCSLGLGLFLLIPLIPLFVIMSLLPIIGMCKVAMNDNQIYYYPFVPRMIRYKSISSQPPAGP
jgi:uncharacterized protein